MKQIEELLEEFENKWCNDLPSKFLNPMCHIDDIRELVMETIEIIKVKKGSD